MNYFKNIILIFVFCFICLAIIGYFLPTEYNVTRSVIIDSTPQEIHKFTGDLSNWDKWSPWIENDPTLKVKIGKNSKGVGASQSWVGEDGSGSLVFTSTNPNKGLEYDLEFNQGQFRSKAGFTYLEKGDQTEVVWSMNGNVDTPIIGGFFARKMDTFVGPDFEKGLKKLKSVVENR
ncbi:MAG: hypothetical protein GTO02_03440 [Candidatus Dadabacteria bacterium]|nr:hypothetical protein [Candidatus Dadabacteria bacterium]NIQ13482.1 hypothetical protein [Candidatus Dadabacteria bacterium]